MDKTQIMGERRCPGCGEMLYKSNEGFTFLEFAFFVGMMFLFVCYYIFVAFSVRSFVVWLGG